MNPAPGKGPRPVLTWPQLLPTAEGRGAPDAWRGHGHLCGGAGPDLDALSAGAVMPDAGPHSSIIVAPSILSAGLGRPAEEVLTLPDNIILDFCTYSVLRSGTTAYGVALIHRRGYHQRQPSPIIQKEYAAIFIHNKQGQHTLAEQPLDGSPVVFHRA
jgi:hypothetical protein